MNPAHVVVDLPPPYPGGEAGRRCVRCDIEEAICLRFPACTAKPLMGSDAKTRARERKRKRSR